MAILMRMLAVATTMTAMLRMIRMAGMKMTRIREEAHDDADEDEVGDGVPAARLEEVGGASSSSSSSSSSFFFHSYGLKRLTCRDDNGRRQGLRRTGRAGVGVGGASPGRAPR